MRLQVVNGTPMLVVNLTEDPKSLLPIKPNKWQPRLRLYYAALDIAIRTDKVTKPGRYGIELDRAANHTKVHFLPW